MQEWPQCQAFGCGVKVRKGELNCCEHQWEKEQALKAVREGQTA